MRQSVWLPVRFDEKMTNCPSGVQVGVPPSVSSKVRRRGVPPDDGTIQRSPIGPPLDWKNTINCPSGEIAGVEVTDEWSIEDSSRIRAIGVGDPNAQIAVRSPETFIGERPAIR